MEAVRVVVYGDVQGVFFRDSCREQAEQVGLTGWVRNTSQGTVEAWFEGRHEAIDQLCTWCEQGPPHAGVERVTRSPETPAGLDAFEVRS